MLLKTVNLYMFIKCATWTGQNYISSMAVYCPRQWDAIIIYFFWLDVMNTEMQLCEHIWNFLLSCFLVVGAF